MSRVDYDFLNDGLLDHTLDDAQSWDVYDIEVELYDEITTDGRTRVVGGVMPDFSYMEFRFPVYHTCEPFDDIPF